MWQDWAMTPGLPGTRLTIMDRSLRAWYRGMLPALMVKAVQKPGRTDCEYLRPQMRWESRGIVGLIRTMLTIPRLFCRRRLGDEGLVVGPPRVGQGGSGFSLQSVRSS